MHSSIYLKVDVESRVKQLKKQFTENRGGTLVITIALFLAFKGYNGTMCLRGTSWGLRKALCFEKLLIILKKASTVKNWGKCR